LRFGLKLLIYTLLSFLLPFFTKATFAATTPFSFATFQTTYSSFLLRCMPIFTFLFKAFKTKKSIVISIFDGFHSLFANYPQFKAAFYQKLAVSYSIAYQFIALYC